MLVFTNLHAWALFGFFYFWIFMFLIKIYYERKREKKKEMIKFSIFSLIFFILSLIPGWWYYVIFKLRGFNWEIITAGGFPDLTNWHNFFEILTEYLRNFFFNFSSFFNILLTFSLYIGAFYLLKNFKKFKEKEKVVGLTIIFATIFAVFNFIITTPIFKKHLSPGHAYSFLSLLFFSLFLGYSLVFIKKYFKLSTKSFNYLIIFFFFLFSIITIKDYFKKYDLWYYKNGKIDLKESFPQYYSFIQYLEKNKLNPNNLVILTTNELSFALYGLTGVQTLNGRLSHFFHFANFEKLWLDSAIIFYSNNSKIRKKVLQKYCKKAEKENKKLYLWWDYYWFNSEWQYNGKNLRPFDPLRFINPENWKKLGYDPFIKYYNFDDSEIEKILKENKIKYFKTNFFFDENFNKYSKIWNVIYITPNNYFNFTHPWNPDLDKYLIKVWSYKAIIKGREMEIAKLFKINCS